MNNNSNNIFKYNNKTYSFFANLYVGSNEDKELTMSLDASEIVEFVYENKLNLLVMTGHVIYIDKYALLDRFLNLHYCYCDILFGENKKKVENDIVIEKIDDELKFSHTFLISDILIMSRKESVIKYKIDLVSTTWFRCISNIHYSNYDRDPELIFDIIKSCIVNNDLTIELKTFDDVKSLVKMNYITNVNDNLFTVVKYLMNKMYYFELKDTSLKFFLYNESSDKYLLFDVSNKLSTTGMYTTVLSFFKTNSENLILQEPTNIGLIKSGFKKTDVYKDLFKYNMFDYSYNTNDFNNILTESETTINYANSRMDVDNYLNRFYKMYDSNLLYSNDGTYWNNDNDLYHDTVKVLCENNCLVLNITGEVLRKPGSMLDVAIDRTMKGLNGDSKKELEELKKKYKAYEGVWFVSKVLHIICPHDLSYRLMVAVFRNFIPKLLDK